MRRILTNQNFRGYDAVSLKTLYVNPEIPRTIGCELKEVCKKEKIKYEPSCNTILPNVQDKAFILKPKTGGKKLIAPSDREIIPSIPSKLTPEEAFLEGGNMFVGKDKNGENWMLIGETEASVRNLDLVAKTYEVKRENITIIPQGANFLTEYHIDLTLRPIGYPYILINNPLMAYNNTHKNDIRTPDNLPKSLEEKYEIFEQQVETLQNAGFKPIPIAGIYEPENKEAIKTDFLSMVLGAPMTSPINFMNAVVNKHKDGSISYITNGAAVLGREKFDYDEMFKKDLEKALRGNSSKEEALPKLRAVYFITGRKEKDSNEIRDNISGGFGGVHCMSLEEPNFNIWA